MSETEENVEIMSKSPLTSTSDIHEVMAGALSAHPGQHFKISLGSSAGKITKPASKLRRAGDISLSTTISSPEMIPIDAPNVKPRAEETRQKVYPGNWQSVEADYIEPEFNAEVLGTSANPFVQKQIELSAKIHRMTHFLVSGFFKENPMEGAEHAYKFCKE
jgi:hypothetical protein